MSDVRLDDALARAAEMVAVCEPMYIAGFPRGDEAVTQVMPDALAGWADAVRALKEHLHHPFEWCAEWDAGICVGCKAIRRFCVAMLGGNDEQAGAAAETLAEDQ